MRASGACSRREPGLEVAAVCGDLDSLLEAVDRERPDVVVTDIRMPPGHLDEGIQAARRLRETNPDLGVVVLSHYANPSYALALLDTGSAGRAYVLKERVHDLDPLVAAIRAVAQGGSLIDPKVVEGLVAERARSGDVPARPADQPGTRRAAEDGGGQEQRIDRRGPCRDREVSREGDQLDLHEAWVDMGARSS